MGMTVGMNHGILVPFMPKIRDAEKVSAEVRASCR
jgi:hypothetical protein